MMEKYIDIPGIYNNRINCQPLNWDGWEKTADDKSSKLDPKVRKLVESIRPDADKHIYVLLTALGAAEAWGSNSNADWFSEDDLKPESPAFGHQTFLNAGIYTHHKNKDKTKSLGEVLLSTYNPIMRRVELIERVDRDKAKRHGASDIYDRLNDGEHLDVSMGCKVKYDVCMLCGNKAPTRAQYCKEMREKPGKILPDGRIVAVMNPRPHFFDISFVIIGAAKNAKVMGKAEEKPNGAVCLGDICTMPNKREIEKTAHVISDAEIGVKTKSSGEYMVDMLITDILRESRSMHEHNRNREAEAALEGIRSAIRSGFTVPEVVGTLGEDVHGAIASLPTHMKLADAKKVIATLGKTAQDCGCGSSCCDDKKIDADQVMTQLLEKTAFAKEYATHSALNLGQAARDVRWIHNHPDADKMGPEGSARHVAASITARIPSLASNLYYATLPPQLHHTDEELKDIKGSLKDNFLNGYAPWKYPVPKDKSEEKEKKQEIKLDPLETELYKKAARDPKSKTFDFHKSRFKKFDKSDIKKPAKPEKASVADNSVLAKFMNKPSVKMAESLDKVLQLKNASQKKKADIIKNIPGLVEPISSAQTKQKILEENNSYSLNSNKAQEYN